MSKPTVDNLCIAFFLFLVLFIPQADEFTRFYFAILLVGVSFLLGGKKLYLDWLSITGIGILFIFVISTILRFTFVVDPNLRDYTEFGRFLLPVLMLIFRDKFKNVTAETFFSVFAFYCIVDFLVSLLAFSGMDFMGIVSLIQSFYVSEGDIGKWYRISGLSAGAGQHGVIMLVLFIFFYIRAFQSKRIFLPLAFSGIAAVPLFLSQSRTSIISFLLIGLGVPIFYLIFGKGAQRKRSIPVLTMIAGGAVYAFSMFYSYFDRVLELLNGIQQVSSFQVREAHYANLFDKALEHPVFFTIGYGKEFFKTSVFDNEYLLMFLVHGPWISLVIVGGVLAYLFIFLLKNKKVQYEYGTILFFLLAAGLVIAYPSTFFLQFSTLPILAVFINVAFWENREMKNKID